MEVDKATTYHWHWSVSLQTPKPKNLTGMCRMEHFLRLDVEKRCNIVMLQLLAYLWLAVCQGGENSQTAIDRMYLPSTLKLSINTCTPSSAYQLRGKR